jgi:diguanylate cyclase (GGDEF)-like protein/PAS domain S-box-containing protein
LSDDNQRHNEATRTNVRIPLAAFLLGGVSLVAAIAGALLWPRSWPDFSAVVWLLALVPCFLFAHYRGWSGMLVTLGLALASLGVAEIFLTTQRNAAVNWQSIASVAVVFTFVGFWAGILSQWHRRERLRAVEVESRLQHAEERVDRVLQNAQIGIWVWDTAGDTLTWDDHAHPLFGFEPGTLPGSYQHFLDVVHPDDRERVRREFVRSLAEGAQYDTEYRVVWADGSAHSIAARGSVERDERGRALRMSGVCWDVTKRKHAEDNLRKLAMAIEQSSASVMITDTEGSIEYVNPRFTEVTGYNRTEVIGRNPRILKSGYMPDEHARGLWTTVLAGREWRGEFYNKKKNGDLYWEHASISPIRGHDGSVTHFLAVMEDMTLRKEYEERLLHQANFDDLTDLPNRVLAADRLAQALARARRNGTTVGVMFIDIDHFKRVNDNLGHAIGDEFLVQAAERLTGCVRDTDTVARFGGDEFLIVMPDLETEVPLDVITEQVLTAFAQPFSLAGHEVVVTASIGITVYPDDGEDPHMLFRNADSAMYHAKDEGRNTYRFFTPEMNKKALRRLELEERLKYALERGELSLQYMPIIAVSSGRTVGAEALLRWENPELGDISPNTFIPVAEETGLIGPIGDWVLKESCREAGRWRRQAGEVLRLAVNISSRQFWGANLLGAVKYGLSAGALPGSALTLEINEQLLLDDPPATGEVMSELAELGVRFAVDDFGTGFSSLGYLQRFRFDGLKIDRSFMRDVASDGRNATLARAIIAMAHGLGLEVIGEGVETEQQLEFLRGCECDMVQGYYFSKPLSPDEMLERVRREAIPQLARSSDPA